MTTVTLNDALIEQDVAITNLLIEVNNLVDALAPVLQREDGDDAAKLADPQPDHAPMVGEMLAHTHRIDGLRWRLNDLRLRLRVADAPVPEDGCVAKAANQ